MQALPLRAGHRSGGGYPLRGDQHARLVIDRDRFDHVPELLFPAPLLGGLWRDLCYRLPQAQRAIADHTRRRGQAARGDIAKGFCPALLASRWSLWTASTNAQAANDWLSVHSLVTMQYTPTYGSRLNQVETWFARMECNGIARGTFTSTTDLTRKLVGNTSCTTKRVNPSCSGTATSSVACPPHVNQVRPTSSELTPSMNVVSDARGCRMAEEAATFRHDPD